MHTLFFGFKRVHLRILALTRPLLQNAFLTPARFDMLRLISVHRHGINQSNMAYLLGVTGATVSRMVESLETLGFIVRRRDERDRRCLLASITERGRVSLAMAMDQAVDSGVAEQAAVEGITGRRGVDRESRRARWLLKKWEDKIVRMRRRYNDPSPARHPWRGGELTPYAPTPVFAEA